MPRALAPDEAALMKRFVGTLRELTHVEKKAEGDNRLHPDVAAIREILQRSEPFSAQCSPVGRRPSTVQTHGCGVRRRWPRDRGRLKTARDSHWTATFDHPHGWDRIRRNPATAPRASAGTSSTAVTWNARRHGPSARWLT